MLSLNKLLEISDVATCSLPSVQASVSQPSLEVFTKGRQFQPSWKVKYSWIKFCDETKKVYCDICQQCQELNLFSFSQNKDDAFISTGYDNWKNALAKFSKHELSKSHHEAALKVSNAMRSTNVAGLVSLAHNREREIARSALMCIVSSMHYLSIQGLAIRGHTEGMGNFENLLTLRSSDNASLKSWLDRSSYKWTSPAIQNEIIQDLALAVLRSFKEEFCEAKYYAIIMDETTDASCKEQVSICLRYVSPDLQVNETFVGFYETPSTNSNTMFEIALDVLTRFQLNMSDCRGQCFDGAANMAGNVAGLQKKIIEIQPKALFVHCMNHSLSLAFQDAMSYIPQCRDAMNLVREIVNFIRDSPKRLAWFSSFQEGDTVTTLRPLCPTRWTMRISSVKSVLDNYAELLLFFQDISDTERGEVGYKTSGYIKQLQSFSMFFSLKLLYAVFSRSETLAHSLQSPKLSLSKADNMVKALSSAWNSIRSDEGFTTLWQSIVDAATSLGVDKPELPRVKRVPKRLDSGSRQHEDQTVEDFHRRLYFSSIDAATACLSTRFQNSSFQLAQSIESTFIDVINTGQIPEGLLQPILLHYGDDIDASRLKLHLEMLGDICRSAKPPVHVTSIADVVQIFNTNEGWATLLPEVILLLRLFLTLPVTSCTAERSFSCLRRLKTFLRSTVTQKRLNNIAVLHCHREKPVNLEEICNNFIAKNEIRRNTFLTFLANK